MISYTITACDEWRELDRLLNFLRVSLKEGDEIVLQLDSQKNTEEVRSVAEKYAKEISVLKLIKFPLNNNFAAFKNNLKKHCNKEWIFNIDADEMPSTFLMENLHEILQLNTELDMLVVPRWNTVEGITSEHIQKWRWRFDELGRINFPDFQTRIYRNKETIKWKNKVHEVLDGFQSYTALPQEKDYCLFHHKTIEKQEKQNQFYEEI